MRRRLQACTAYTGSGFPEFKNAANAAGDKCIDIGPHTITFTETISHSGSLEVISSTGNGVLSGGGALRMFYVTSGNKLDLEDLTLSDGNAGSSVSISRGALPHSSANTPPHSPAVLWSTMAP